MGVGEEGGEGGLGWYVYSSSLEELCHEAGLALCLPFFALSLRELDSSVLRADGGARGPV